MKTQKEKKRPSKGYPVLRIINRALAVLLAFVLPLAVFAAFLHVSGERFGIGGWRFYKITTGSMEPAYKAGDYVITRRKDPGEIKAGEVIAFVSQSEETRGQTIIHRVFDKNAGGEYITRGDFNPANDYVNVGAESILGVVVARVAFLRHIDGLFSRPWAFGFFIVAPIVLIMAGETAVMAGERKRRGALAALIIRHGFCPRDKKLSALVETYGENVLTEISESLAAQKESESDKT